MGDTDDCDELKMEIEDIFLKFFTLTNNGKMKENHKKKNGDAKENGKISAISENIYPLQ